MSKRKVDSSILPDDVEALKNRIRELEGMAGNNSVIKMDDLIPVMSLLFYPMNLSTKERGQGDTFRFDKFGQVKRIVYSKLLSIIEVHQKFLDWGYFIIMDDRVLKAHGLTEKYEKILNKEKIERILNSEDGALELYKSSNEEQQKTIIGMIINQLRENPNSMDMNVIDAISRFSGIKIMEKVEDSVAALSTKNE